jgi:hypothetical protein
MICASVAVVTGTWTEDTQDDHYQDLQGLVPTVSVKQFVKFRCYIFFHFTVK